MIDTIDRRLKEWVTSNVADADVRLFMPIAKVERPTVVMVLLQMAQADAARSQTQKSLGLVLHYLVTVCAKTIEEALPLIDNLFVSALDHRELSVGQQPISPDVWETIGARPQPAFRLVVPLPSRGANPDPQAADGSVRAPSLATFDGVVLGPNDEPIPRVRVQLLDSSAVAYTDRYGRFRFPTAVASPVRDGLQVFANGLDQAVVESSPPEEPLIIRLKPKSARPSQSSRLVATPDGRQCAGTQRTR